MRNNDKQWMETIDRRRARRIRYTCEVECEMSGLSRFKARINDLSTTGVFMDSVTAFAVDSVLKLRFLVGDTLIDVVAQVRYCIPQVGIGVQFLDLRPDYRAVIAGLTEGLLPETPAAPDCKILMGNFADVSFFDVIQIIENSRLTGKLTVALPTARGQIYFNYGEIVGAQAGEVVGIAALDQLIGASEGSFDFVKSPTPYERTIRAASNLGLLLDMLTARDEASYASLEEYPQEACG